MSKDLKSSTEGTKTSFSLDGVEIYDPDGQTIADIRDLDPKEILQILDIKKDCKSSQK